MLMLAAVSACVALSGCGTDDSASRGPTVVATTTQLADMARNVVGDRMRVVGLLQPNADAHSFEPTASELSAIATARVVIANGAGLDPWITKVMSTAGSKAPLVLASTGVTLRQTAGGDDPHIWMDPQRALQMVATVRDAAATADPANAAAYRAAATDYLAQIRAMDGELARQVATVPARQRRIVTDHDAIGYLADRYGIRVIGAAVPSLSAGAEPNAQDLAALASATRASGVQVVFAQAAVNPAVARALAAEAGVAVGAQLYVDSLGPTGSGAATYLDMLRSDVAALVDGMRRG